MATRPESTELTETERDPLPSGPVELDVPGTAPATPEARQRITGGREGGGREKPVLPPGAPRILCVDDEPAMLKILTRALETDFEIVTANDPLKALVLLEHGMDFSVVISDMKMPQMDGAEFLARVARITPSSTRLALTACLERELSSDEVFGILTKPCPLNLLQASVQAAVDHHSRHGLLRRSGNPGVPPPLPAPPRSPASFPRREDSDPTRLLPHLVFDPWSHAPGAVDPLATQSAARLSVLAAVAEKFFRLGNATEAERILRPALWDLLQRCESDRRESEPNLELAGKLALRLADDTQSAQWIDYLFRVFTSMSRPLSTYLIEQLHDLVRRVPGVSRSAYLRYLNALRASRHEFGPAEHFLIRRIEDLEPLIWP